MPPSCQVKFSVHAMHGQAFTGRTCPEAADPGGRESRRSAVGARQRRGPDSSSKGPEARQHVAVLHEHTPHPEAGCVGTAAAARSGAHARPGWDGEACPPPAKRGVPVARAAAAAGRGHARPAALHDGNLAGHSAP